MPSRSTPYAITATLHESGELCLYRAVRNEDRRRVILEAPSRGDPDPNERTRLENSFRIAAQLDTPFALKPIAMDWQDGTPVSAFEDFDGEPIDQLFGQPICLAAFLRLAIRLTEALAQVHRRNVVHNDLQPGHILVNATECRVKLTGFAAAAMLTSSHRRQLPRLAELGLPYMSPEQTGRTSHVVDRRSDLYSLGVILYELLSSKRPFEAKDPLEWVYCHVAMPPAPVTAIRRDAPIIVSDILTKLLAKVPDERYQSARGVQRDFERCLAQWSAEGRIDAFTLGQEDISDRLQLPQILYGRERELHVLLSAFQRVADSGTSGLAVVMGPPGIGKSSLVGQLAEPIVERRGFFVSGKFEQHRHDVPYRSVIQAFRELALHILGRPEHEINDWKRRLRQAVDPNGGLLIELVPHLELLLGTQPLVPELPPTEAEARFHLVCERFLGVFATAEHPVAIYLDDLQWADAASLKLLRHLVCQSDAAHLLVLAAYRNTEVHASHPLTAILDEIRAAGRAVATIALEPLGAESIAKLVADTFRCSRVDAESLGKIVHDKTAGNPFFAIEFLRELDHQALVQFDHDEIGWRWDIDKIRALRLADNVVDLMLSKLKRLDSEAHEVVKLAACLGSRVDSEALALTADQSEEAVHRALLEPLRQGLLGREAGAYFFQHDRIQEAAYALITEDERPAVHLRIGRRLLEHTEAARLPDRAFDIVNQMAIGKDLIDDSAERIRLAELALVAGRRAKSSAAYRSACGFFATGMDLLPDGAWDTAPVLSFDIYVERAECEIVVGGLEVAAQLCSAARAHARSIAQRVAAHRVNSLLYEIRGEYQEAIESLVDCMQLFDVQLAVRPTHERVLAECERVWRNVGDRRIEDLIDLPPMTDELPRMGVATLAEHVVSGFLIHGPLFHCLLGCHMIDMSLRYGNSDQSALGYVYFGIAIGPLFGRYRDGYRFAKLGCDLVAKRNLVAEKARAVDLFSVFTNYWMHHVRTCLPLVYEAHAAASRLGQVTWQCYTAADIALLRLIEGDPLEEISRDCARLLELVRGARFVDLADCLIAIQSFVETLRGESFQLHTFDRTGFDERQFEQRLEQSNAPLVRFWYLSLKMRARLLSGDGEAALEASESARPILWAAMGMLPATEYSAIRPLVLASLHDRASAKKKREYEAEMVVHETTLREWAGNCAENFGCRLALVSAEIARVRGADLDAIRGYEEAISSARVNGFVQHQALSYELAARFYQQRGFELFSDAYLREARACYQRWGAVGKVRDLEQRNPRLRETSVSSPGALARLDQLDLLAMTKASQAISGEMDLDALLRRLMEVAVQQSGARRATLILARGDQLRVEAEARLTQSRLQVDILQSAPIASSSLPVSIVQSAWRTGERVLLEDVTASGPFATDKYLAEHRHQSILCFPIMRRARAIGLMYLENDLSTGAFAPERLASLDLLAAQAAISLENVNLLLREKRARAEAEEAERCSGFLANASRALAESLDYDATLAKVARLVVPFLGDWCVVDVTDTGATRFVASAHADPAKESLLDRLRERYPFDARSPQPGACAIRTGEIQIYDDVTDAVLEAICKDEGHVRLVRALGTRSAVAFPLFARNKTLGSITIVSAVPVRDRDRCAIEVARELARRISVAIDNAMLYRRSQDAVRARDEFFMLASHELRTPVTSLLLAAQAIVRKGPLPETVKRSMDVVERQTRKLDRLVNEILSVSRIHVGSLQLQYEHVDLAATVRHIAEDFAPDVARAHCSLSVHAARPIVGLWDLTRLEQIIVNLVSNAIKFGAGKPIEIDVDADDGTARLIVADHGIGIARHRQARIFERFERAVSPREYGGLGLGLFVADEIVRAHGGTIRVDSEIGAGSTFTVDLPRHSPRATP